MNDTLSRCFLHRPAKRWDKILLTVSEAHTDEIATFLGALCGSGTETISGPSPHLDPGEERIIGYLEHDAHRTQNLERLHSFLNRFRSRHPRATLDLVSETIDEEDWNAQWKAHFKPVLLTERLVVKPSWEDYRPAAGEVVLVMDPGMAFGTGHHASTQLLLGMLDAIFQAEPSAAIPQSVLDVGTGTGILGLACALFGAQEVVGIDNDPDARAAAVGNVSANRLEAVMSIPPSDLEHIQRTFDLVLANITMNTILDLANDLIGHASPGGLLAVSGILRGDQETAIKDRFTRAGLRLEKSLAREEWVALCFRVPGVLLQSGDKSYD